MVMVDNLISSFADNLDNGIHITSYFGQGDDYELKKKMEILKQISRAKSIPDELVKIYQLKESYKKYRKNCE